jgi:cytochrome P450
MTEEDVAEEVDTFMFAGHDTTSCAVSFALYCIGLYPEIQERVHQEMDTIFEGDAKRPVSEVDLKQMPYLECVLKESMRLYPTVPVTMRELTEKVDFGDYVLPSGTTLWLLFHALHMDPEVFPDPQKFDPERFTDENSVGRHPYAFCPFSAGPRGCIGQKFALMEAKVILAHVLRRFVVSSPLKPENLALSCAAILRLEGPLKVNFTPRNVSEP